MLNRWVIFFLVLTTLGCISLAAEATNDFPFASGPQPHLSKLANGQVQGNRIKTGGSQLSMGVETYYLSPLSPDETLKKLRSNSLPSQNGATQSFGIDTKSIIHIPPLSSDFNHFSLEDKLGRFGLGGSSMRRVKPKDLNLTQQELSSLLAVKKQDISQLETAWKAIFMSRSLDFQNQGFTSYQPYEYKNKRFNHRNELVTLLLSTPQILNRFKPLIGGIMTGKYPEQAHAPQYSWESSKVQGDQTIALMCLISAPYENGRIQIVETSYYVTGNYYTSMIFRELTPVFDNETGQTHTLAWRGDYVITESIGFLRGIERIAAENIMMQEVIHSVESFVESISP